MPEPRIERKKLTELTPDPSNANTGTERGLRMLDDSISQYGLGRSAVIDKNRVVIAGNKTLERAIDSGFEDAIIVHTTGDQLVVVQRDDLDLMSHDDTRARMLAFFDNRVSQVDLNWSPEQLLADVNTGLDLSKLFSDDEMAELLSGLVEDDPAQDPGAQVDKAAELQKKWQVERGDVWVIPSKTGKGSHRLMCGDSTSKDDVERLMDGEYADLVVTDPPYGVGYASKNEFLNNLDKGNRVQKHIENDHSSKEDTQHLWKSAFEQMSNVMRRGAVVYCFMPQGGDQMMMMMMMMGAGIEPRHELIWIKNNHVLGRVDYAYKHEPILYAWKDAGHKFYGDFQTSIIECDKPLVSDLHPTMKPVELICKLINNSSQAGEVVYDLFLGSGTTLVAAESTQRQCYGLEIEPSYCAVILERVSGLGLSPFLIEKPTS